MDPDIEHQIRMLRSDLTRLEMACMHYIKMDPVGVEGSIRTARNAIVMALNSIEETD